MPATPLFQSDTDSQPGSDPDESSALNSVVAAADGTLALEPASAALHPAEPEDAYARLQRRLILATLIVSALAVPITALLFDRHTAGCLLVGALAGVLYLRLLARSVEKLGNGSKKVGKLQLLVPVVLVLAAAKLPQLELLPALIGFLLYKPAVILQAVVDR